MEDQGRRRLRARTYTKFQADPLSELLDGDDAITPADRAACAAGLPPGRMTAEEKLRFKSFITKKGAAADYLDARNMVLEEWEKDVKYKVTLRQCLEGVRKGHVKLVKNVFHFLEHDGRINGMLCEDRPIPDPYAEEEGAAPGDGGVSDKAVLKHLHQHLKTVDMETTTEKQIRAALEEELKVDLKERKAFIREEVTKFLDDPSVADGPDRSPVLIEDAERVAVPPFAPKKVIVVGAGPSGIAAALHLQSRGLEVTVLEGRGRVGGRVSTDKSSCSAPIDLGASIITGTEADPRSGLRADPTATVCRQVGLFEGLVRLGGALPIYDGLTGEKIPEETDKMVEVARDALLDDAQAEIDKLGGAEEVSLGAQLEVALGRRMEGGGQSEETGGGEGKVRWPLTDQELRVLNWHWAALEYGCSAPLDAVSLPNWNQDEAYGGFGGPHCMIPGGYGQVLERMAEGVKDLRRDSPVARISHSEGGGVEVAVEGEEDALRADHCLVTVPLGVLQGGDIAFEPALPDWKQRHIDKMGMGNLNKVILEFSEAFWGEESYFGAASSADPTSRGDSFMFWNLVPVAGKPLLIALDVGRSAAATEVGDGGAAAAEAAMAVLRRLYPGQASEPLKFAVSQWKRDRFARGSYSYIPVGASAKDYDGLAAPVDGRLFFAGEHTCKEHPDTVGGAMLSGLREARRILRACEGLTLEDLDDSLAAEEEEDVMAEDSDAAEADSDADVGSDDADSDDSEDEGGRGGQKRRRGESGDEDEDGEDDDGGKAAKKARKEKKKREKKEKKENGVKKPRKKKDDDDDDAREAKEVRLAQRMAREEEERRQAREEMKEVYRKCAAAGIDSGTKDPHIVAELLASISTTDGRVVFCQQLAMAPEPCIVAVLTQANLESLKGWMEDATASRETKGLLAVLKLLLRAARVDLAALKASKVPRFINDNAVRHTVPEVRHTAGAVMGKWRDRTGAAGPGGGAARPAAPKEESKPKPPPPPAVKSEGVLKAEAMVAEARAKAEAARKRAEEVQAMNAAAAKPAPLPSIDLFPTKKEKKDKERATKAEKDKSSKPPPAKEPAGAEPLAAAPAAAAGGAGDVAAAGGAERDSKRQIRAEVEKYVQHVLKPLYMEKAIDKEGHKTVTHKAVMKVMERAEAPTPGEEFLSSRRKHKIKELVHEYVKKLQRR